jgi:hypothetical protein
MMIAILTIVWGGFVTAMTVALRQERQASGEEKKE